MKKITLLSISIVFISIISFISCSKSSSNSAKSPVGTWRWIDTYYDTPISDSNPKTPANTNKTEILIFNSNNTFKRIMNNVDYDSGNYTYGHGTYINLSNTKFDYDSILYFHYGHSSYYGVDYYLYSNDTLFFSPGYADQYSCYSLPNNGAKWWVKF